jgi:hypothetical protein
MSEGVRGKGKERVQLEKDIVEDEVLNAASSWGLTDILA